MPKALAKQKEDDFYFNTYDPEYVLKKIQKSIAGKAKIPKGSLDLVIQYESSHSLDNYYHPTQSVLKKYRPNFIQIIKDLEAEYKCKRPSEKMILHNIANAYIRILAFSERLQVAVTEDQLGKDRTDYYNHLSKEVERANKQYAEGIRLLMQMRMKPINVNIKTQNAMFGKNQLNVVTKDNLLNENH